MPDTVPLKYQIERLETEMHRKNCIGDGSRLLLVSDSWGKYHIDLVYPGGHPRGWSTGGFTSIAELTAYVCGFLDCMFYQVPEPPKQGDPYGTR